jgi:hypothetical protein
MNALAPTGHGDPTAQAAIGPLELAIIARAGRSLRSVRRAERVAATSGWLTLLAGGLSLPFVFGSGVGLALAVTLVVVGLRELRLRRGLGRLEAIAGGRLCRNQIALGLVLAGYAGLRLMEGPASLGSLGAADLEQVPELAAAAERVAVLAHYGIYLGLAAGAVVVQGSQAAYYAAVGRRIARAWAAHPVWVMRVHAAAWGGAMPDPGGSGADGSSAMVPESTKAAA